MASDWRRHEVAELLAAGKLVIGDGYRAKNSELGSSGLPFARAGNIDDGFRFDDADFFPEDALHRVGEKVSEPGDVVFTSKGTVGRFALVGSTTQRFVYSPQLCFWRSLDRKLIDPRFLYYWMCGREFYVQYKGVAGQTDMADYVSLTDQRRMNITLPPFDEQGAIAEILGALDDKIELNRRMSDTLEAMARGFFKSWFVDFDPVHAKAEGRAPAGMDAAMAALFPDSFEDSGPGKMPAGWETIPLAAAGTWRSGGTPSKSKPEYWGGDIPWVSAKSLNDAVWVHDAEKHVTLLGAESGTRTVPRGSVLFVVRGMSLASEFRIGLCSREVTFNQDLKAIVPTGRVSPALLTLWLRESRPSILGLADEASHGTKRLQTDALAKLQLVVPRRAVQERLVAPLDALLERIGMNDKETTTLGAVRDLLLPKLLAGELHVRDADRIVEQAV